MANPLRSIIGMMLLVSTISLASCQSMFKAIATEQTSSYESGRLSQKQ
jgi:hypothetical protein